MTTQIRREQIKDSAINNAKQAFGTPSAGTDVAIKSYVDQAIADATGASNLKDAVRVATTTAGTLASSFANGQTVDGVVLATGNRILIKNQASGAENGIYVVQASGAPVRSTDADTASDIEDAVVYVSQGTVNADTGWKLVTDSIVLGTTALVFTSLVPTSLTSSSLVRRETPAGAVNGANVSYTLANTPVVGSEEVFLNGVLQTVSDDYTISGSTITYAVAPIAGDVLRVNYTR
jgi:hypothetical protein